MHLSLTGNGPWPSPAQQQEQNTMKQSISRPRSVLQAAVLSALSLLALPAWADDDDERNNRKSQATASFGRGLNTAQQGNTANHAILPAMIKIKVGGVVDFAVAGFHDIVIFKPGFTLQHLVQAGGGQIPSTPPAFVIPASPTAALPPELAFLGDSIYYRGINPAGGPLATAVTGNPANGSNRTEPVAFLQRGTYLVICNVRPHLLDGMYAYVTVD
jgi:plastocyanin